MGNHLDMLNSHMYKSLSLVGHLWLALLALLAHSSDQINDKQTCLGVSSWFDCIQLGQILIVFIRKSLLAPTPPQALLIIQCFGMTSFLIFSRWLLVWCGVIWQVLLSAVLSAPTRLPIISSVFFEACGVHIVESTLWNPESSSQSSFSQSSFRFLFSYTSLKGKPQRHKLSSKSPLLMPFLSLGGEQTSPQPVMKLIPLSPNSL